jgi:hypothetical protein
MADAEDVREAAAALIRKRRSRAREMWHNLQWEGYDSLEELQQETEELNVPTTWAGKIGGRSKVLPGMENVTTDDLPLSRKAVNNMIQNLSPEDRDPLKIDRYQQFLESQAEEEALFAYERQVRQDRQRKAHKAHKIWNRTMRTIAYHAFGTTDPQTHREPPTSGLLCVPYFLS